MKKDSSTKKAEQILSSMDSDAVKSGIERLKGMSGAEAKKLRERLDGIDKNKVLKLLGSLSPEAVKEKLNTLDLSKLSELDSNGKIGEMLKKDNGKR